VIRLNGIGGVTFENPDRNSRSGFLFPACRHPERNRNILRRCRNVLPRDSSTLIGTNSITGGFENSREPLILRGDVRTILALEDGRYFEGESFGATGSCVGEICFNTSMTGYQEVLTDPSYRGQIVAMTYPLIGNYGINSLDDESRSPHVRGFVIEELTEVPSNWRSEMSLGNGISPARKESTRARSRGICALAVR
jgi:hypothetical protein